MKFWQGVLMTAALCCFCYGLSRYLNFILTRGTAHVAGGPVVIPVVVKVDPPKPLPVITIEDMQQCNRRVRVYHDRPPRVKSDKPQPILPQLSDIPVGANGWVSYLLSYDGKVYARDVEDVSPTKLELDADKYSTLQYQHNIHIKKVVGGIQVDCDETAFIEPQGELTDDMVPVVGMFRSK